MILIIIGLLIVIAALLVLLISSRVDLNEAVRALDSLHQFVSRSPYAQYGQDYAIEKAEKVIAAHYGYK